MKIKDLLEFNPEAEIKIILPNYLPFDGNLGLGWSLDGKDGEHSNAVATEVCIFLNDKPEKESWSS